MSETDRVAVVVVHGIADQRPGQTVRELVRLLCHGDEGAPRYVQGEMHGTRSIELMTVRVRRWQMPRQCIS